MKKNTKMKSLFGALALMVMMSGSAVAKAETLTEDKDVEYEGTATFYELTEEDYESHKQDEPGTQDAGAVISDVTVTPLPTIAVTGTDYSTYEPTEEDLHPSAGLEDEIERKDPTPTPTQPIPKTGEENTNASGGAAGVAAGLILGTIGLGCYAWIKVEDAREFKKQLDNKKKMH